MKRSDPIRVLVIDDSAFSRQSITRMLKTSPLVEVVGVARDGEEALRKAFDLEPDLITLDITMPERSGVAVYRKMREDDQLKSIPVIIITGVSIEFEKFISTRRQVPPPDGFISKPVDHEQFLSMVRKLLA